MFANLVNIIPISFYSVFAVATIVIFVITYRKKFYNDKLKSTWLTSFVLLFVICGIGILLNANAWEPNVEDILGFSMLFGSSVACSMHLLANDIGYRGNTEFKTMLTALSILTVANGLIAFGVGYFFQKYFVVFLVFNLIVLGRILTIQIKFLRNSKRRSLICSVVGYGLIFVGFTFELLILLFDLSLNINGEVFSYTFINIFLFTLGLILIQIMILLQGDGAFRENILRTKH